MPMADPSRRALVVGLAALPGCCAPFVTVATANVMPEDDPIFAAIKRHRHASAELGTIDELADPVRYAAAETEIGASGAALFATRPASVAGAVALSDFIIEDDLDAAGSWSQAEALPPLTPPA
jgi:hypothetical protein